MSKVFLALSNPYQCILCFFIVDQLFEGVEQRPRSLSDPVIKQLKNPENTFQQQSLHIVACTEKKRRLEAERKLKKLIAGQSLDLRFPELKLYADKSYKHDAAHDDADDESDDNSSTTSTLDEGNVFFFHYFDNLKVTIRTHLLFI